MEGYWLTTTQLLLLLPFSPDHFLTGIYIAPSHPQLSSLTLSHSPESQLVAHIQTVAKAKAEKAQLYRSKLCVCLFEYCYSSPYSVVESCSSDTIRNAVKILQDLQVLVPVWNGDSNTPHSHSLDVANSNHLDEIIKQLTLLRD